MWGNYVVRNIVLAVSLLVIVLFAANLLLNLFTRHNKHVEVPDFMNMTLDEALAASREDKLRIEVNDSLYVPAFDPGVILEQRPAAGTEVKPGRRIYVTVNSSQQRMIDVPYVAGYSLRQAKNILETAGLEIEKLVYVDDIATNNVLEQRVGPEVVAADNRVQARVGSGVVLTVGRAPGADLVSVPRVVGLPLREAKSRIWEAGLNVAGVTLAEDIDRMNLRQARVYLQQPDQGHRVVLGTGISIALSLDSLTVASGVSRSDRYGNRVAAREQALRDSLAAEGYSGDELQEEMDWIIRIENGEATPAERRREEEDAIVRSLEEYGGTVRHDDESEFSNSGTANACARYVCADAERRLPGNGAACRFGIKGFVRGGECRNGIRRGGTGGAGGAAG